MPGVQTVSQLSKRTYARMMALLCIALNDG